jgi:CO/xanthine dehydrogenase Mo-binding subunit
MSEYVGKPIARYDGIGHVTGRTSFVDDVDIPGMLYVKVFRSPVHKGTIRNLDLSGAENMPGVAGVISAKDIPGNNAYGLYGDQPVFPSKQIRYKGERIAAVAAVDEDTAMEALDKIRIDIDEETAVLDPFDAMKPGAASMGRPEGNLWANFNNGTVHRVRLGDVEEGFAKAAHIVETTYTQAMNEHAPMETQASVAYIDPTDRLVIHTCSQDLYFHLGMLSGLFNLPMNKIRYAGGTVGGGFGAKNDIHCDHVAGAMALKIRKPVKYRLTRVEETLYTTKRGMFKLTFKDGIMKDGSIVARHVNVVHDTGAYSGMGPYAVEKNSILVAGPYNIPNIAFDGTCVFSNRPPCSSMRGFAIINGTTAVELQMDRLAEVISMDPWEIRMINAWRNGDLSATQVKVVACAAVEVLQKTAVLAGIELPQHLKTMSSDRR